MPDLPVVERVQSNHGHNEGEGDNEEGKVKEDKGVDEGVEGKCEQNHQQTTQDHCTKLDIFPVQYILHWNEEYVQMCIYQKP